MKLLNEANIDDEFNSALGKIQDAIDKLKTMKSKFEKQGTYPVSTQLNGLKYAAQDLNALHDELKLLKK